MRRLVAYGRYSVSSDSVSSACGRPRRKLVVKAGVAPNRYISSHE